VRSLRRRIEHDYGDWLATEFRNDPAGLADARAAILSLDFVLPRCLPNAKAVIDANYDAPAIADLVVKTAGYADSGRKQFVHSLGKEGRIRLIPVWVAGEMAPYRRNWSEFGLP
jgi:hypothetical protein